MTPEIRSVAARQVKVNASLMGGSKRGGAVRARVDGSGMEMGRGVPVHPRPFLLPRRRGPMFVGVQLLRFRVVWGALHPSGQ